MASAKQSRKRENNMKRLLLTLSLAGASLFGQVSEVPLAKILTRGSLSLIILKMAPAPIPMLEGTAPDLGGWFMIGVSSTDPKTTAFKITVLSSSHGVSSSQMQALPSQQAASMAWTNTIFQLTGDTIIESVLVEELAAHSSAMFGKP